MRWEICIHHLLEQVSAIPSEKMNDLTTTTEEMNIPRRRWARRYDTSFTRFNTCHQIGKLSTTLGNPFVVPRAYTRDLRWDTQNFQLSILAHQVGLSRAMIYTHEKSKYVTKLTKTQFKEFTYLFDRGFQCSYQMPFASLVGHGKHFYAY